MWSRDSFCEHEDTREMQITFKQENHNPTSQRDLRSRLAAELLRKSSMQTKTDRQTTERKEGKKGERGEGN